MIMAQRNLSQWLFIPCLLVSLVACGEKAPVTPAIPAKPQPKKTETAKAVTEKVEATGTTEAPPSKYVYVTENRRDPFVPFLLLKRPVDSEADLSAQTPLQQYETLQYKLSAIIIGYNQPMARAMLCVRG